MHFVMFEEILRVTSKFARCLQGNTLDLASALHQSETVEMQFDIIRLDVVSVRVFCRPFG